jgi:hypothetical protein
MYKTRMLAQAIVTLFVILVSAAHFGYLAPASTPMVLLALLAALWLARCRTTWLPFLGPSAMPVGILQPTRAPDGADFSVTLKAPADAIRVMYWGAILKTDDPIQAYGGFTNAGIADVSNGQALLQLRKPKAYSINGKALPAHVHYRWITAGGMLSGVRTALA